MIIINSTITVIYGDTPFEMTKTLLEETEPFKELKGNEIIGIKPNLVVPKSSDSGATTSPEIVAGIIEHLQDRGFVNIHIMESCWRGDKTPNVFKACGYDNLSQKYNVPLVDLKKDETVPFNYGGFDFKVARNALDVDFLVNVPVLKVHCQVKLTCALKNLKGCIPDKEKSSFHSSGLHKPLACLNKAIKTDLIIVDGIMGDLTSEQGGDPVQMNRIIAGKDPVMVDAYACELMGYSIEEIKYISLAEEMGIGSSKVDKDNILELNKDYRPQKELKPSRKVEHLTRWIEESDACSPCFGSLVHALERLQEKGKLDRLNTRIYIGQGYKDREINGPGVGLCTRGAANHVPGCPPSAADILHELEKLV